MQKQMERYGGPIPILIRRHLVRPSGSHPLDKLNKQAQLIRRFLIQYGVRPMNDDCIRKTLQALKVAQTICQGIPIPAEIVGEGQARRELIEQTDLRAHASSTEHTSGDTTLSQKLLGGQRLRNLCSEPQNPRRVVLEQDGRIENHGASLSRMV